MLSIIQIEIFYYYNLDLDNNLYIDFVDLLKRALRLLSTKKKLIDLVWTDKKSDQIEDLVNKYKRKAQINSVTNYSVLLPVFAFQSLITISILTTYSGTANYQLVKIKID